MPVDLLRQEQKMSASYEQSKIINRGSSCTTLETGTSSPYEAWPSPMDSGYYGRIRGRCAIILFCAQCSRGDREQSRWGDGSAFMVHLRGLPLFG